MKWLVHTRNSVYEVTPAENGQGFNVQRRAADEHENIPNDVVWHSPYISINIGGPLMFQGSTKYDERLDNIRTSTVQRVEVEP